MDEGIRIATAVFQADCEAAQVDHRPKCRMTNRLLRQIARSCPKDLRDDCIKMVTVALDQAIHRDQQVLLAEIKEILLRAAKGELELQSFHGRLKLESALAGVSLAAVARFTKARAQTVINWGAGLKAPTLGLKGEIPKMEAALGLKPGYLSGVYVSNWSGPSRIKSHFLPKEVLSMSDDQKTAFRRLFDPEIDIAALSGEQREKLMAEKLAIFYEDRDTIDHKRAKLRFGDMKYGLKELPDHLEDEFDSLVAARTNIIIRNVVRSKWRGWDDNSKKIYHDKFCLFFGWLHHHMGVPLENLSIAYFAFTSVLLEFDDFLLTRKEQVGMERRWAEADRGWYVFAGSLTRRGTDGSSIENDDNFDDFRPAEDAAADNGGVGAGWLRAQRTLLSKIVPIDLIRLGGTEGSDDQTALPVLAAGTIAKAKSEWSRLLDLTTRRYRALGKSISRETSKPDCVSRIVPILRFENPLDAIEMGAMKLRERAERLREGSYNWCIAVRDAVTLKIHAQQPFRRATYCGITFRPDGSGMIFRERDKWIIAIPASLFKNEKTEAFQQYVQNGYYTAILRDNMGLYEDLAIYVEFARERILCGAKSDAFYVNRGKCGHVTPSTFAGRFRDVTREHIAENRGRKTGLQGVRPFGSQAMRHIVATAVFWKTGNIAEAAAAIHDSEKMTERHYKHLFVTPQRRAKILGCVLESTALVKEWRPFRRNISFVHVPTIALDMPSPQGCLNKETWPQ